jgi:hypothetical protein
MLLVSDTSVLFRCVCVHVCACVLGGGGASSEHASEFELPKNFSRHWGSPGKKNRDAWAPSS